MIDRLALWPQHRAYLTFRGRAANTIRHREALLRQLTVLTGADLADQTRPLLLVFLGRPNLSKRTRGCYRAHVVTFYAWCEDEGLLERSPAVRIPKVAQPRSIPAPMTDADFAVATAGARQPMRVWLFLGSEAGLRCDEMAGLSRANILGRDLWVTGKGDKQRLVPITDTLAAELERAQLPAAGLLFPGKYGQRRTGSSVSDLINDHLHRLGIASTAHKLRHRYGTRFLEASGGDLRLTQEVMGHASPQTTAGYTKVDLSRAFEVAQRMRAS